MLSVESRRRLRVLKSLGITAGLTGFVATCPSRSLGQEARPNSAKRQWMTEAAVARIAAARLRGCLFSIPIHPPLPNPPTPTDHKAHRGGSA